MQFSNKKLFLFDIDGTLILTGGNADRALCEAFRQCFSQEIDLSRIHVQGVTDRGIARQMLAQHSVPETDENEKKLLATYLRLLPEHLAANPSRGRILPGIPAFLNALAETPDSIVALLTGNLERGARIKLSHFGIWDKFSFGAFADDSADRNDLGAVALRRAGDYCGETISPDNTWIIGDTPRDIACGKVISARTLAVATGNYTTQELALHSPDLLFNDFSDTPALLTALLR